MRLRYLTAGESHGKALSGIIEGVPSGIEITSDYIHTQLKRRKLGFGRGGRQSIEDDSVEILSGVRHGKTLGSPIGLLIFNKDWKNWENIMQVGPTDGPIDRKVEVPRPGHADLIGGIKYNHSDLRNVLERSSARETAMRVAIASVARKFLGDCNIHIASRVTKIGPIEDSSELSCSVDTLNKKVDSSQVRCMDKKAEAKIIEEIKKASKDGNTLGGVFEVYASGAPLGLGSYAQWDRRLEAEIGKCFLSLNAIKGVEVGMGFQLGEISGSQAHDEIFPGDKAKKVQYKTNRAGGIVGGMTSGQIVTVKAAMKPLSTLMTPLQSVHFETNKPAQAHVERSDVCAVPAAAVIGESLLALILANAILDKFGGDSLDEISQRVGKWRDETSSK